MKELDNVKVAVNNLEEAFKSLMELIKDDYAFACTNCGVDFDENGECRTCGRFNECKKCKINSEAYKRIQSIIACKDDNTIPREDKNASYIHSLLCEEQYKYIVLKRDDVDNYLSKEEKDALDDMIYTINYERSKDREDLNTYLVVNTDEPYAEEVAKLILENQKKEEK